MKIINLDKRFDAFKEELELLCIKHKVQIAINMYEELSVTNLPKNEHPLQFDMINESDEND